MSSDLPEDWKPATLGDALARAEGGGTPPRDVGEYWNGDIPWASVKDIVKGDGSIPEETITSDGLANSSSRMVKAGTNIFAARMGVGAVARYSVDVAINQDLVAMTPNGDLDPDYLFHWLRSMKASFAAVATGTTVKGIRRELLLSFPLLLPPLDEQRRIAEVLRSVDEAIAAAESAVAQAEHALNLNAEKLLVQDLAQDTKEHRLVDAIASLDAGVSVNSEGRPAADGEIGILKTSCVSAGHFNPEENKVVRLDEVQRTRVQPSANSIIISRMNTLELVGANAFVGNDYPNLYLPDRLWLLKTKPSVVCRWLAFYMKTARFREQIIDIASGTSGSMKNISKGRLADLVLHIPEYSQQELAVEVLSALEIAIVSGRSALQSYQKIRQALMSDLLSGHVRVPA